MRNAQQDADLAGVRRSDFLASLPPIDSAAQTRLNQFSRPPTFLDPNLATLHLSNGGFVFVRHILDPSSPSDVFTLAVQFKYPSTPRIRNRCRLYAATRSTRSISHFLKISPMLATLHGPTMIFVIPLPHRPCSTTTDGAQGSSTLRTS